MISQKARLSEGPLVRKSDEKLPHRNLLICEQPYDQLFVFIYLLLPVTTPSTFLRVALLIMFLNLMLLTKFTASNE